MHYYIIAFIFVCYSLHYMLLKERQRIRNQNLDLKLKSINLDLELMNNLSKHNQGLNQKQKLTATNSLSDLARQLKQKNNKLAPDRQAKIKTVDWLQEKGINLRSVYQQIKNNQAVVIDLPSQLKDKQNINQSMKVEQLDFNPNNQMSFIRDYRQLAVFSAIKITMNSSAQHKSSSVLARLKLINRLQGKREITQEKVNNSHSNTNTDYEYIDPIIQQNLYSEIVKQAVLENNFSQLSDKFYQQFQNRKPFWKIVNAHVSLAQQLIFQTQFNSDKQLKQVVNCQLMLTSLKIVQNIFDQKLPTNKIEIENLFKKLYGGSNQKKKMNLHYNEKGTANWGVGYLLYRAGRVKDFYHECLAESKLVKLRQEFIAYDESVNRRKPFSSTVGSFSQIADDFYDQFMYILRGQSRFVSSIILDYYSLQTIWVVLRTMGIYRNVSQQNENDFQQILASFFQKYQKYPMSKQEMHNALYLGAYRNILQLLKDAQKSQQNGCPLSYNDYFHLLLIVYKNKSLWSSLDLNNQNGPRSKLRINPQYEPLKELFQQNLVDYLIQLKNSQQGQKSFMSYFMLFSPQAMITHSKQLIKTIQDFNSFRWSQFKQLLKLRQDIKDLKQFYSRFVYQILKGFQPQTYSDYKFLATKFRTFIHDDQTSMEIQVELLAKNLFYSLKQQFQEFITQQMFNKGSYRIDDQQYLTFLGISEFGHNSQNFNNSSLTSHSNNNIKFIMIQLDRMWEQLPRSLFHTTSYKSHEKSTNYQKNKMLRNVMAFLLEVHQLQLLIEEGCAAKLKKIQPKFLHQSRFIQENLRDVLVYLSSKNIFNLYVYYLKSQIRRSQVICEYQNRVSTSTKKQIIKQIQKLQNENLWYENPQFKEFNEMKKNHFVQDLKSYIMQSIGNY